MDAYGYGDGVCFDVGEGLSSLSSSLRSPHLVTKLRKQKSKAQLKAIIENKDLKEKEAPMIFREVLDSDLPPEEKTIDRLWHDGQTFNIAGSETTAWTMGNITYYLLTNPDILRRLKEELRSVVKDGMIEETNTAELEQLPYLVGGFRLCFGRKC